MNNPIPVDYTPEQIRFIERVENKVILEFMYRSDGLDILQNWLQVITLFTGIAFFTLNVMANGNLPELTVAFVASSIMLLITSVIVVKWKQVTITPETVHVDGGTYKTEFVAFRLKSARKNYHYIYLEYGKDVIDLCLIDVKPKDVIIYLNNMIRSMNKPKVVMADHQSLERPMKF